MFELSVIDPEAVVENVVKLEVEAIVELVVELEVESVTSAVFESKLGRLVVAKLFSVVVSEGNTKVGAKSTLSTLIRQRPTRMNS